MGVLGAVLVGSAGATATVAAGYFGYLAYQREMLMLNEVEQREYEMAERELVTLRKNLSQAYARQREQKQICGN